jgi:hypothetical protein
VAKLPSVKLLPQSDYKDQPLLQKLTSSLNQFIIDVVRALDKGLTVSDNMVAQINEKALFVSDSAGSFPFAFAWQNPSTRPRGCIVVRADTQEGDEGIFSAVQPKWSYNEGRVVIEGLRGDLDADRWYDVTFYTFG